MDNFTLSLNNYDFQNTNLTNDDNNEWNSLKNQTQYRILHLSENVYELHVKPKNTQ